MSNINAEDNLEIEGDTASANLLTYFLPNIPASDEE